MEAWVAHIREEWLVDGKKDNPIRYDDRYSVWTTHKQALKSVAEFLKEEAHKSWSNLFVGRSELSFAIQALIETNNIEAAIGLMNKYTILEPPSSGSSRVPHKIIIKVEETKFLGSPFE
jgi:hypothetical protein